MGEGGEAITVGGGDFEGEFCRRRVHAPCQRRLYLAIGAGKERLRLADQLAVVVEADLARARRRAALDLVEEARPRAALVDGVRAGADQERLLQRIHGAADRAGGGERAEIAALSL